MPYAVAAAAIAAGGAIYSADAAKSAANKQVGAGDDALRLQQEQFNATRQDSAPFLKTGTAANTRLAQLLGIGNAGGAVTSNGQTFGSKEELRTALRNDYVAQLKAQGKLAPDFDPADPSQQSSLISDDAIQRVVDQALPAQSGGPDVGSSPLLRKMTQADIDADPVYQSGLKFGASQGEDAINARATQAGSYDSGATLKALTRFNSDYASTKAGDAYNRFTNDQNNVFNKLSGISGTGQVATNQVASAGANAANNMSATLEGQGNARAAGVVGGANAWGNAGASASGAINNYQNNQLLQKLLAQNNGGGGGTTAASSGYYGGIDT